MSVVSTVVIRESADSSVKLPNTNASMWILEHIKKEKLELQTFSKITAHKTGVFKQKKKAGGKT